MLNSIIIGSGSYLPEKVVTNNDLSKLIDTSHEWIFERTGIKKRHIAMPDELSSDMAKNASEIALKNAGIDAKDIDLIIVATTTPDRSFPSTACLLQAKIGAKTSAAFDVQAVCAGFVFGLNIADNYIKTAQAKNILLVGVDKMSALVDWNDRNTCVLFGDGAGAVVISAKKSNKPEGIIASKIQSDGSFSDILITTGGIGFNQQTGFVKMQGKDVFKHAVEKMSQSVLEILKINNLSTKDIDILIPHQANIRILESVAKKIDMEERKIISTISDHANTSAASIPLALDYAILNNKIKKKDLVAITAIGGGLSWGSALINW